MGHTGATYIIVLWLLPAVLDAVLVAAIPIQHSALKLATNLHTEERTHNSVCGNFPVHDFPPIISCTVGAFFSSDDAVVVAAGACFFAGAEVLFCGGDMLVLGLGGTYRGDFLCEAGRRVVFRVTSDAITAKKHG